MPPILQTTQGGGGVGGERHPCLAEVGLASSRAAQLPKAGLQFPEVGSAES